MIQGWDSAQSDLRLRMERGGLTYRFGMAGFVRFSRHVLRDLKTWRGFDTSGFGHIFHPWWINAARACSGLLSGCDSRFTQA